MSLPNLGIWSGNQEENRVLNFPVFVRLDVMLEIKNADFQVLNSGF
jgi:hypothetical protein